MNCTMLSQGHLRCPSARPAMRPIFNNGTLRPFSGHRRKECSRYGACRTPESKKGALHLHATSRDNAESSAELDEQAERCSLDASTSGNLPLAQPAKPQKEKWSLASWKLGGQQGGLTRLLAVGGLAAGVNGFFGSSFDLAGPESIVQALGVLAAIVAVHETGHFLAARLQNIHVAKFSIGFGPALFKYQGAEVEYSLRAIPLGGFVAFPDDDPSGTYNIPADDPDLMKNRPILDRAIVISAGVIANVIFAFTICLTQVSTVGIARYSFLPGVAVPIVMEASPAEKAGLQVGDVILKVGDKTVEGPPRAVPYMIDEIKASAGQPLPITVQRKGESRELVVVPNEQGRIGVQLSNNALIKRRRAQNPLDAVVLASSEFSRLAANVTTGLRTLLFDFGKVSEQVSGPIAIVAAGAEVSRSDPSGIFQFAAIVNINLAVVNVLPLPALDGGYLALLVLEALRGKKLPQGVENGILASGTLLLTMAGIYLLVHDSLNILGI